MGDARKDALRVEFDIRIKLEFHGAAVTSDAGLIARRLSIRLAEFCGEIFPINSIGLGETAISD